MLSSFLQLKWGKPMTNQLENFWQNTLTEILEKGNRFMQMDTLFDETISRFKEFSTTVQKLSGMDVFTAPKESQAMDFSAFFELNKNIMGMNTLYENFLSRFKDMSALTQPFNSMALFMNPVGMLGFDFKKNADEVLKWMGLISIEEYQSLIKKYEDLKKQGQDFEKIHSEQTRKISELNQAASADKKKTAAREKSIEDSKSKLDEQKKIAASLSKELDTQKKQALSLEKELNDLKKLNESLKKDITEKDLILKKIETAKS
jgi:hypothetical protein